MLDSNGKTFRANSDGPDKLGRAYATGKRKNAIARVWVSLSKDSMAHNSLQVKSSNSKIHGEEYFCGDKYIHDIMTPFRVANSDDKYTVWCTVSGGGKAGQSGAVRLGIAKALVKFNHENRIKFKPMKLLTRDSRVVERKKINKHKARKAHQYSKR